MPLTPFTIPAPADAHFLNGAANVDAAHFRPYLLPGYNHNAGTYGADLFDDVPVYVLDDDNRSTWDYTTDNGDVRTWLGYERTWARLLCAFCRTAPADFRTRCANRPGRKPHRAALFRCQQTDAGAAQTDFWGAACGSFACLGRASVPNVPAPLELCDAILERQHGSGYPTAVRNSGPAGGDLNLGGGGIVDHARLVTLQGLLNDAIADAGEWDPPECAFHYALLRLQLDLYGFTTADGVLGNGDVGIATHASNWYSFDHFGIKTQVATTSGNVVVYAQKVTDSPVAMFCNSLWDEHYHETVVKVTRIPARLAWVLSHMQEAA